MFDVRKIVADNRATYYDYVSGRVLSRTPYWTFVLVISIIAAITFAEPSDNFLGAVITAQSILAGFGFNVLFFLLSTTGNIVPSSSGPIESALTKVKMTKLSEEIFSNISYFNLVSILSVFVALVALMPSLSLPLLKIISDKLPLLAPNYHESVSSYCAAAKLLLRATIFAALYVLVIESVYTFIRTVGRITFFFRKKLEIINNSAE